MLKNRFLQASLIALFALVSVSANAASDADKIEFKTLDGKVVKLSDYKGKWVIVNYWATWCPPCRVEMPELGFFHEAHKNNDAIVLGVNYEDAPVDKVKTFLEQEMIKFPVVRPKNGADGRNTAFGPLKGLPTTYMVTPEGNVVAARTGLVDQKVLEGFIEKYNKMMKEKKG